MNEASLNERIAEAFEAHRKGRTLGPLSPADAQLCEEDAARVEEAARVLGGDYWTARAREARAVSDRLKPISSDDWGDQEEEEAAALAALGGAAVSAMGFDEDETPGSYVYEALHWPFKAGRAAVYEILEEEANRGDGLPSDLPNAEAWLEDVPSEHFMAAAQAFARVIEQAHAFDQVLAQAEEAA